MKSFKEYLSEKIIIGEADFDIKKFIDSCKSQLKAFEESDNKDGAEFLKGILDSYEKNGSLSPKQVQGASKFMGESVIHEGFSSDSDKWFEILIDDDKFMGDAIMKTLANQIENGKLKPTESGYEKFKIELSKSKNVPRELENFISDMDNGKYDSEFKKMYGKHSQVSELFSFFRQGVNY